MTKQYSGLSKTDFLVGNQCSKALWLDKNREDLKELYIKNSSNIEVGYKINELSKKYFDNYKCAQANLNCTDVKQIVLNTKNFIDKNFQVIFEAAAINDDLSNARIDILKKDDNNNWSLIEVKSSTKLDIKYLIDIAYQYYIFLEAGYQISSCYLMLVNNKYQFDGNLDLKKFFKFEDVTSEVIKLSKKIKTQKENLKNIINSPVEPEIKIGSHCFKPSSCNYKEFCWKNVPDYSIFDVVHRKTTADKIANEIDSYSIEDIDLSKYESGLKSFEINNYLSKKNFIDKEKLNNFLNKLSYPLFFLDYESVQFAVPIFKNTKPYQQIPFQFSLHVQLKHGQELQHFEFLHTERSDPRKFFIENLLKNCGDKGSIIVYNESFEKSVNNELANDFPEYFDKLKAINNRIIDLIVPFKNKYIYSYKQQGSNSIKKVLPAYTDLNYNSLEIKRGDEAMKVYYDFMKNQIELDDIKIKNLLDYCKMDSYAMYLLLSKLYDFV